jgi:hypothetical protein
MRSLHPLELRKLMLEAAKPHWEAAIAAAAALGGAAISADAQDSAAKRTAGALAVPKAQPQGYSPVATAFGGKNSSASGADLAGTFSKAPLPELPKGRDAADVFRLSDALGKTDLSGQPPPIPGSAAAGGEPATMPRSDQIGSWGIADESAGERRIGIELGEHSQNRADCWTARLTRAQRVRRPTSAQRGDPASWSNRGLQPDRVGGYATASTAARGAARRLARHLKV